MFNSMTANDMVMAELIDGKLVSDKILEKVKSEVDSLKSRYGAAPSLHAIIVGDDPASQTYVRMKKNACKKTGMDSETHALPADISQRSLEALIGRLNENEEVSGILVQLPLPKHIDKNSIMDSIHPDKDVDGFSKTNVAKLYRGEDCLEPCTPRGVLVLLDHYKIPVEGRELVIIGRSDIVGKPLSIMLSGTRRNATVTLCHSKTHNLQYYSSSADILIAAIGRPEYVKSEMVEKGAVVIDVGVNRVDDICADKGYRLVGDVDFNNVSKKASYITPVPGGVGPMTIACLMENTLKAYKIQKGMLS